MPEPDLNGCAVFLVEDEYLVASQLSRLLGRWGARVVGPASTVGAAMQVLGRVGRIDCALLDIDLRGSLVYPVADACLAREIPFAFTTSCDPAAVPPRYRSAGLVRKPYGDAEIAKMVTALRRQ